jgi:hypothetical protein
MGSETCAATGPKGSLSFLFFSRFRPIMHAASAANNAPATNPPRKPTPTAGPGKGLHLESLIIGVDVPVLVAEAAAGDPLLVPVGTGVMEDADVEVPAMEEVDVDGILSVSIAHCPPLHEYPAGQHASPHVSNFVLSFVLLMTPLGCSVAFCRVISQVIGSMSWQSEPDGQQMMDVAFWRGIHCEFEGQQKLDGRRESEHREKVDIPQVLSRGIKSDVDIQDAEVAPVQPNARMTAVVEVNVRIGKV